MQLFHNFLAINLIAKDSVRPRNNVKTINKVEDPGACMTKSFIDFYRQQNEELPWNRCNTATMPRRKHNKKCPRKIPNCHY